MKKYISIYILLAFLITACDLEETNINPNDPLEVPMEVLLPPALEAAATEMAESAAVTSGIFAQYFTGVDNRAVPIESYLLDESFDMNPLWEDIYTDVLSTLNIIIQKAEEAEAPHYSGIAKTMTAMTLGTATSLWGDIPYNNAFGGGENPNATFDSQQQIYERIQTLLDEAIDELARDNSIFSPGTDDVIYNGDLELWTKAAYGLKARYWMHTIKVNPDATNKALEAIPFSFSNSDEEMIYTFGFTEAEQNTWFVYFNNTPYVEVDESFINLLENKNDPREKNLIKSSFGLKRIGEHLAGEFASIPLVTFSEIKFLEAEALLRSQQAGVETVLQEAMTVHIEQVTAGDIDMDSINNYVVAHGTLSGMTEADLEVIMTQKYISHFTQIEGWTDYRRTGYPQLAPNEGGDNPQNPGGAIPRRFIYPQNERLFNSSFPSENPNLQQRFWWDVE